MVGRGRSAGAGVVEILVALALIVALGLVAVGLRFAINAIGAMVWS